MEVIAKRGNDSFLVKISDTKYAFVNMRYDKAVYSEYADTFLKHGYFEDCFINEDIITRIEYILARE